MATDGDVVALGFGSGAAHYVITLGFDSAAFPVTPANVGAIGNMPDFGSTLYSKPEHFQVPRWRKPPWSRG